MLCGLGLEMVAAFIMLFFEDEAKFVGEEESAGTSEHDQDADSRERLAKKSCFGLQMKHIPWVLFIQDVTIGLGSGMTG